MIASLTQDSEDGEVDYGLLIGSVLRLAIFSGMPLSFCDMDSRLI